MKKFDNNITELGNYLCYITGNEALTSDKKFDGVMVEVIEYFGFLQRYIAYDLATAKLPPKTKSEAENYINDFENNYKEGKGVYICGELGVGKTSLATIIAKTIFINSIKLTNKTFYSMKFITFNNLVSLFRRTMYNRDDRKEYDELLKVDLLVIDNVGNEYATKNEEIGNFAETMLDELLKYRTGNNKPTIMTSNIAYDAIETLYGQVIQNLIHSNLHELDIKGVSNRTIIKLRGLL